MESDHLPVLVNFSRRGSLPAGNAAGQLSLQDACKACTISDFLHCVSNAKMGGDGRLKCRYFMCVSPTML